MVSTGLSDQSDPDSTDDTTVDSSVNQQQLVFIIGAELLQMFLSTTDPSCPAPPALIAFRNQNPSIIKASLRPKIRVQLGAV